MKVDAMAGSPRAAATKQADPAKAIRVPAAELLEIDFASAWRESPLLLSSPLALLGCRVVGTTRARLPGNEAVESLLLRHIKSKSYRVLGAFGVLDLPSEYVDDFLQRIRQGHHGGPGRCQGTLTRDGFSYTRKLSLMISTRAIRWSIRHGRGVLSLGLRKLATEAAVQLLDDAGQLAGHPLPADNVTPGSASGNKRCHAYLDDESIRRFRAIGEGNLSLGIRRAQQHVAPNAR
jgi:hypothetical protein